MRKGTKSSFELFAVSVFNSCEILPDQQQLNKNLAEVEACIT